MEKVLSQGSTNLYGNSVTNAQRNVKDMLMRNASSEDSRYETVYTKRKPLCNHDSRMGKILVAYWAEYRLSILEDGDGCAT